MSDRSNETLRKFEKARRSRTIYERQWYINASFRNNQHYMQMGVGTSVEPAQVDPRRVRLTINRLQAKLRVRLSKRTKNRPKPIVIPATSEYQDHMNAKASQKVLDALWRKLGLQMARVEALQFAEVTGKGFWWFHYDQSKMARVAVKDPATGSITYEDQQLGEIVIEPGSAYEVFVPDQTLEAIGRQPWVIRAKMRDRDEMIGLFPDFEEQLKSTSKTTDIFNFVKKIAGLQPQSIGATDQEPENQVLVIEYYERPSSKRPKGAYQVIVGDIEVKFEEALPFNFNDLQNPYPVVEFFDQRVAGKFWPPAMCESLIDIQREYNLLRSKLAEHLRLMALPKLLVATQHQLADGVWTADAGEVVEFTAIPGVDPPAPWHPPNVAADLWSAISLIQKEFDDISLEYPVSAGATGGTTSGFQTNLLQEASDQVHAVEFLQDEASLEDAAMKMRRMMKLFYDTPRLIAIAGLDYEPDVIEFSNETIDEAADVIIQSGSGLPDLKAARQEMVQNLFREGLLGEVQDADTRRRALALMDLGAVDEVFDVARVAAAQARRENLHFARGEQVQEPKFWENHAVHYDIHASDLMSPSTEHLDPALYRARVIHLALHGRHINPDGFAALVQQEGLSELQHLLPPPPGPQAPPSGPVAPGEGQPPNGPGSVQ